jgi:hypothetical protein
MPLLAVKCWRPFQTKQQSLATFQLQGFILFFLAAQMSLQTTDK